MLTNTGGFFLFFGADNIFSISSWCKKKLGTFDEAAFFKNFGVPVELDYLP